MRIQIITSGSKQLIPFDHKHLQVGSIHKWFGENNLEHGKISLYSFSWLDNFTRKKGGLVFNPGAGFFFSCHNPKLMEAFIGGITRSPEMFDGLKVTGITILDTPDFANREVFYAATPVFIKRKTDDGIEHITYKDERAGQFLTETIQHKMLLAGFSDTSLSIKFDTSYAGAKERLIPYRETNNKTSLCPLIINGLPESKLFAWNVGVGNSTGVGFGAIK